ncbi:SufE family protein [Agrococcus baldri]|uniref:Cysteine desufuration protein SufE n=1 Tax=Agrococcus baldri TaxID=153730 RepID=A0AA87US76_9MICO|nr:SufE family protein [Agrococcus baldri]GEK80593.1 cysteine desufuration protein SufE [Agrococcus baldri]
MTLTPALQQTVDDFHAMEEQDRLQLLLEFADELPALPPRYAEHPDLLERVAECQSPVFLFVEVDERVHVHATAPEEAPTTRGFASILAHGLEGASVEQALDVPSDFPRLLGLDRVVSPLRLRGMAGMLGRIQRQLRAKGSPL